MATYTVNVDVSQLQRVFGKAEEEAREYLEKKVARIVERLVKEVAQPIAQDNFGYGGAVTVTTEPIDHGYAIVAEGRAVCFLEFGAGVYSDTHHPFIGRTPFTVKPGSWSETHARTWQHWVAAGKDPKDYPFNQQPTRGLYEAYRAVLQEIDRIAREELAE